MNFPAELWNKGRRELHAGDGGGDGEGEGAAQREADGKRRGGGVGNRREQTEDGVARATLLRVPVIRRFPEAGLAGKFCAIY